MTTREAAPPPLSIPPPPIEPLSDDDGSSPLSDVEDKDDDTVDFHTTEIVASNTQDEASSPDNLSDANDTEAETERLYDTPRHNTRHHDAPTERIAYDRTPSKLRNENRSTVRDRDDKDVPLSDEDVSMGSSPPAPPAQSTGASEKLQSPTLDILAEAANQQVESRKRKRSSMPRESLGSGRPSPQHTGSLAVTSQENTDGDAPTADEDEPSSNTHSGEHSADEGVNATAGDNETDGPSPEVQLGLDTGPKKQTRSSSRKAKDTEENTRPGGPAEEGTDAAVAEEEGAHTGEDEHMDVDVDEEAEVAHKNEEELERKRVAFEQLSGIEKRFATFRERLYEERLQQLNQEEAMLRAATPTHPEYLAMMQCVDARRDEKLRAAQRELDLSMESLGRWAVAKRAQVHSQFFQSVREYRERILAELGQHWYDIQHERRKNANTVPEFGLRFPPNESQRLRNALAYNKEVSILSGVAKYEGMPAAPEMRSASAQDLDDDFDAMSRGRPSAPRHMLPRPSYAEYGGLPFGGALGPAGEQFLEQTPWANPNHPSNAHLLQRQQSSHHDSPIPPASSGPASGSRRHTQHPNPFTISSGTQPHNGNAKPPKSTARHLSTSPEVTQAASVLEQTKARSMKALESAKQDHGRPAGGN
ncbi:Sds3-like-domain-containing protein [Xylariaceae sp. FL0804]|nr:Sds3-like-domain-containing protein [Xylariaceae sp. FL0804]